MPWWGWVLVASGAIVAVFVIEHFWSLRKPLNRLHNYASKGNIPKMAELLAQGVDVNAKGQLGITALSIAVVCEKWEAATWLLEQGADPNDKIIGAISMVALAADAKKADFVRQLQARGADMNARNRFDWTPLLSAIGDGDAAMVQTLLESGASPEEPDGSGSTPLQIAVFSSFEHLTQLKEDPRYLEIAEALLKAGTDPNKADVCTGLTPLGLCALRGMPRMARLLLEYGAHPNLDDRMEMRPRDYAVEAKNDDIIALLDAYENRGFV